MSARNSKLPALVSGGGGGERAQARTFISQLHPKCLRSAHASGHKWLRALARALFATRAAQVFDARTRTRASSTLKNDDDVM